MRSKRSSFTRARRVCTRTRAHAHDLTLQLLHEKQRRERGRGRGERDADATCAYARTHRAMAEKRQYHARVLLLLRAFLAKIYLIDLPRRKKKKIEFIYRHFRSLAQNYRQNKIILENRKEKRDKKKEKCTRRDCVVFPKRAWAHNVKMLKDKEKGR